MQLFKAKVLQMSGTKSNNSRMPVGVRALLDTGSFSDFISTTIVDQMKLEVVHLSKPIVCQMAASGSRTMITSCVDADLQFQEINEKCRFNVINLENHNSTLGTPFLWQHKVIFGFNLAKVVIGSLNSVALYRSDVAKISSMAMDLAEDGLEKLRLELIKEAADLCIPAEDTPLPPLCIINHKIPIIDESKVYSFRPSSCPKALKTAVEGKMRQISSNGKMGVLCGKQCNPHVAYK